MAFSIFLTHPQQFPNFHSFSMLSCYFQVLPKSRLSAVNLEYLENAAESFQNQHGNTGTMQTAGDLFGINSAMIDAFKMLQK